MQYSRLYCITDEVDFAKRFNSVSFVSIETTVFIACIWQIRNTGFKNVYLQQKLLSQ